FPETERWHDRLNELPAWREPFPEMKAAACTRTLSKRWRMDHATAPSRIPRRMAQGAQGASEAGEGGHAHERSRQRGTAPASLGENGKGLCVRHAGGEEKARRSLRRQQPASRLSLHVALGSRAGM